MKYLLDTNICIYIIKKKPAWVIDRFSSLDIDDIGVSSITSSELYYGVAKSQKQEQNRLALFEFFLPLNIVPYDQAASSSYGDVRAYLEKKGSLIGPLDLMIAAHALSLGLTLVTNNIKEFERIGNLNIENWADN